MLYVEKGGEIIPKIVGVDEKSRMKDSQPVRFVTHCPICGTPLERVEGEAAWVCPNKYHCPPQIAGRIEHFVGRRMMNIDGLGEELVYQLFASGRVEFISDLYNLTKEDLLTLYGIQEKSAERLLQGIEKSKEVPFARVIFALSIPNVGETTAKLLAKAAGSMDRLMAMSMDELSSIDEIGPIIAESIVEYFAEPINREIIESLRVAGLRFENEAVAEAVMSDKLAGKKIVISGVFAKHSRDEYKKMIEQNGGKNVGSISGATDFVLAGENMGPSKLEKANKLGVKIIDEDTFLNMLAD